MRACPTPTGGVTTGQDLQQRVTQQGEALQGLTTRFEQLEADLHARQQAKQQAKFLGMFSLGGGG